MTDTTLINDPFIWIKDDVLSANFCNDVIKRFEESKSPNKSQGTAGYSVNTSIKDSLDLHISTEKEWQDVDNALAETLYQGIPEYIYSLNQSLHLPKFNLKGLDFDLRTKF